jgi:hypothetical protein
MAIVLVMAAIPCAICWFFFFGLYGALGFAIFEGAFIILVRFLVRKYRPEKAGRLDKAMGKPGDDPRQMARFVP